jgi:hypothetical protein
VPDIVIHAIACAAYLVLAWHFWNTRWRHAAEVPALRGWERAAVLVANSNFTVATANNTAAAGGDSAPRSFAATIPAGSTSTSFDIAINGDTSPESDDSFFVNLGAGTGV